jgi:hypothetical protein
MTSADTRRSLRRACPALAFAALLVAIAAGAVVAAAPAAAAAAPVVRTGTTAGGVPFVLRGRSLRIVVPTSTRRGRRIEIRCGSLTSVNLTAPGPVYGGSVAVGSSVFRGRRTLTLRLSSDVSKTAEWCEFETEPSGRRGAAVLNPRLAPPPAPLVAGPGVREAVVRGGRARFLLDGSTLTLRTAKSLPGDILLFLACYARADASGLEATALGVRTIAIGPGRRAVTVDLGRDVEAAAGSCFAESSEQGDLFLASFPA